MRSNLATINMTICRGIEVKKFTVIGDVNFEMITAMGRSAFPKTERGEKILPVKPTISPPPLDPRSEAVVELLTTNSTKGKV